MLHAELGHCDMLMLSDFAAHSWKGSLAQYVAPIIRLTLALIHEGHAHPLQLSNNLLHIARTQQLGGNAYVVLLQGTTIVPLLSCSIPQELFTVGDCLLTLQEPSHCN